MWQYHKLEGLKQQKFILNPLGAWVGNQGVGRASSLCLVLTFSDCSQSLAFCDF
jgi:hypothetical protein